MESSSFEEPVDAIVLAGSINKISLYPGNQPGRKALVELLDKPLLSYTLEALHEARGVGRVVVVGAPDVLALASRWPEAEGVPEGRSLMDNIWRGLRAGRTERVLFCNPDQPLLKTEMVDGFLERALPVEGDIISGWIREEDMGGYPEAEHKLAAFADGKYAHGNLFLARRDLPQIPKAKVRLEKLYAARKSNLRFAWALGPSLFARFMLSAVVGRLPSLDETLEIAGKHFGVKLAGVRCPWMEIAIDIDEPEDYAFAERFLTSGGQPAPTRVPAPVRRERATSGG